LLCDQEEETMQHLMTTCPFSWQIWHDILAWLRMTCQPPDQQSNLAEWWPIAKQSIPKSMRKGLAPITLLVPWMIWKHRNDSVFNGAQPSATRLIEQIKKEAALWAQAGAHGLRVVLPQSWDVH
jgi:hypothetical protein